MNLRETRFAKELETISRQNFQKPAKKKKFVGKIILMFLFFLIILVGVLGIKVAIAPDDEKIGGIFTQIKHLVVSPNRQLKGEAQDRINIVLLGIGGEDHIGPLLTDTMILLSLQPSTKKVAMISIPRDLLVDIPNIGNGKINHAYALIESKNPKQGGIEVKKILENIFSTPIDYYLRIDFRGFEKLIDELGGISVNVEHTLDDPTYPVAGEEESSLEERYEHLVIEKGIRFMNGSTALKYVRSRKATGVEGSDFARSRRQQKVLLAIKDKVLAPSTLFNISRLNRAFSIVNDHTDTDIELWEMLRLYDISKETSSSNILNIVLDDGPNGPLQATTVEGAFVLVPKKDDWSDLEAIAKNVFDENAIHEIIIDKPIQNDRPQEAIDLPKERLKQQKKNIQIEVHNGTKLPGLAKKTSDYLTGSGYQIIQFGNAPLQTYKKSLIYDLNPENKKDRTEIIKELESLFKAVVFTSGKPSSLTAPDGAKINYPVNSTADILIIIGEDWRALLSKLIPLETF